MESSNVGQIEKLTQARVVKLFCESLGYEYLGNWIDRMRCLSVLPARLC